MLNPELTPLLNVQSGNDVEEISSLLPKRTPSAGLIYKIVILLCISFVAFGGLFVYDSVSALETEITNDLSLSKSQFELLFSAYSLPNIIFVVGGGFIADKIGSRRSSLLFGAIFLIGSAICALGPSSKTWFGTNSSVAFVILLIGRFIFGVGTEAADVVQNIMCIEWFQGKHLSKAMGVTTTVAHLASVLSFATEADIAKWTGSYLYAMWFAAFTAFISVVSIIIYIAMDIYAEKRHWKQEVKEEERKNITFKDVRHFSRRYWVAALIVLFAENVVYSYKSIASEYIGEKWNYDEETSNFIVSIVDITAMIGSPLLGLVVDLTGFSGWAVLLGNTIGVAGFAMLGLTDLHPAIGTICVGLQYSFINAGLYPSIAYLIQSNFEGTAYSIITASINLTSTGLFPLAGWVADNSNFMWLCMFFAGLAAAATLLSVVWNLLDATNINPILNRKKE